MSGGRWGRGSCEGWSLDIGHAFRAQVVRSGGSRDEPVKWRASINSRELGAHESRDAAMLSVEHEISANMSGVIDDWTVFRAGPIAAHRRPGKAI